MATTKIEWAESVWNCVSGCSHAGSPGCDACYARTMANRLQAMGVKGYENGFAVTLHQDKLQEPLKWKKPRRIFVCSMGDIHHSAVPHNFIDDVFDAMLQAQQHTYIMLTKRPENALDYFNSTGNRAEYLLKIPSLWYGTTCENQEQADKRIPVLLQIPAAVRYVSVEPMLSKVNLKLWQHDMERFGAALAGRPYSHVKNPTPKLDFVIAGCESGPKRRPANIDWFRSLRDQCVEADVPFFLKQMEVNGKLVKMPELDGRVWDEYPKERVTK